jgi:hypothetical protein
VLGREHLPRLRLAAVQSRGFYVGAVSTSPEPAAGTRRRSCSAPGRLPYPGKARPGASSSSQRGWRICAQGIRPYAAQASSVCSSRRSAGSRGERTSVVATTEAQGSLQHARPARAPAAVAACVSPQLAHSAQIRRMIARETHQLSCVKRAGLPRQHAKPRPRGTRAVCAPRVRRNAMMRKIEEARGSAPSSAIRGSPAALDARSAQCGSARAASAGRLAHTPTHRSYEAPRRVGNAWGRSAAKCRARSRVPPPKRARARFCGSAVRQNADWAYESERKACSSGRGAQRPGLCAERAPKHDRLETAAAASERRDA